MPHPLRQCTPGELYHITARGNNRQAIFNDEMDYREYLQLLYEVTRRYAVNIHAFALMPNHVHLLLQPVQQENLSAALQVLNSTFAKYINRRYGRIGHLFQGRYHSSHVDREAYLLVVSRYIHNNPVRAGLAKDATQYPWSSARAFTGELDLGSPLDRLIKRLVDTALTLSLLSEETCKKAVTYREFLKTVSDTELTFKKM